MKAIIHIDETLQDNAGRFDQPFFADKQKERTTRSFTLPGGIEREYQFPVFFGNATVAMAIFMCDYQAAADLLPDAGMAPVRMPRGRAVVAISNYIYRDISNGLAGYTEIVMNIPVILNGAWSLPVLPLVLGHKSSGYYPLAVPCASLENQLRGAAFWGVPKLLHDISIEVEQDTCRVAASEPSGEMTFRITIPRHGKPMPKQETVTICSMLQDQLALSRSGYQGEFKVRMNSAALFRKGKTVNDAHSEHPHAIELGTSPVADTLRRLDMEAVPFQTRYADPVNSWLALPHRIGKPSA